MPSQDVVKPKPLKKIRLSQAKWPWEEMRSAFIEGMEANEDGPVIYPDARQLAKHFGAPLNQIRNRISKERWEDHKTAFQNKIVVARQQTRVRELADQAVQFDGQGYDVASLGQQLVQDRLNEMMAAVVDQKPLPGRSTTHISGYELEKLANALRKFQETGHIALGVDEKQTGQPAAATQNVQLNQINIGDELGRSDPQRIAGILSVLGGENTNLDGSEAIRALLAAAAEDDASQERDPQQMAIEGEVIPDPVPTPEIDRLLEVTDGAQ